jgi:uncharacterized protein YegP (UPF0339 family)
MSNVPYFDLYRDSRGEYRWRFRASNGRIIADSAEGYVHRSDCEAAIRLLKSEGPAAPVV